MKIKLISISLILNFKFIKILLKIDMQRSIDYQTIYIIPFYLNKIEDLEKLGNILAYYDFVQDQLQFDLNLIFQFSLELDNFVSISC